MNLLRPITIHSAGNERNNVFHHYKTLTWKISANQRKFFQMISENKVGELIHQITHCYRNYYFNVKHHQ